ncbi:MAG: hypothetical protein DMG76_22635 [Acidobacteria bacterium]|nr:MAG: hypothetical protein DMG76_22635 [Acidobacteriota bacterium]
MPLPQNTRRWPRHPVDLQVRVLAAGESPETMVPGRGTEMSEGGMLLYAGILLNPGDMLELEFSTPSHSRMQAVVRYRDGYCFGLEFIAPITA